MDKTSVLHVIELDRDLIVRLQQRFGARLVLHAGDALTFDFASLSCAHCPQHARAKNAGEGGGVYKPPPLLRIVGNLPYNISSPLLFHLLAYADCVADQHFMLQNELAERIAATPGSSMYGRLSVMLQYRYAMDKLIDVPPASFMPSPRVHSALLRMTPHASHRLPPLDWACFSELVSAAFSQRRKMLRNTLAAYRAHLDFDALDFDLGRRAQDVPVNEYIMLAQHLHDGLQPKNEFKADTSHGICVQLGI